MPATREAVSRNTHSHAERQRNRAAAIAKQRPAWEKSVERSKDISFVEMVLPVSVNEDRDGLYIKTYGLRAVVGTPFRTERSQRRTFGLDAVDAREFRFPENATGGRWSSAQYGLHYKAGTDEKIALLKSFPRLGEKRRNPKNLGYCRVLAEIKPMARWRPSEKNRTVYFEIREIGFYNLAFKKLF